MLFECEFCGEQGMEIKEGKEATPWHPTQETIDIIEMKCIKCGVHEPCEANDLVQFMMEILGESSYNKAMLKTLKILWRDTHMKEMVE
jgi:hypothetical protein|tara:strand:+ start:2193 stop:2456 length:264 start_codon:yes stop_codon:yes gene_type:complete